MIPSTFREYQISRIIVPVPDTKGTQKKENNPWSFPEGAPVVSQGIDAGNVMISLGPVITERERVGERARAREREGQRVEDTENNLIIDGGRL